MTDWERLAVDYCCYSGADAWQKKRVLAAPSHSEAAAFLKHVLNFSGSVDGDRKYKLLEGTGYGIVVKTDVGGDVVGRMSWLEIARTIRHGAAAVQLTLFEEVMG